MSEYHEVGVLVESGLAGALCSLGGVGVRVVRLVRSTVN